jgi:hypothetical protein
MGAIFHIGWMRPAPECMEDQQKSKPLIAGPGPIECRNPQYENPDATNAKSCGDFVALRKIWINGMPVLVDNKRVHPMDIGSMRLQTGGGARCPRPAIG